LPGSFRVAGLESKNEGHKLGLFITGNFLSETFGRKKPGEATLQEFE